MDTGDSQKDSMIDKNVLDNTLVGLESLRIIAQLSEAVRGMDGCVAEVGVYRGGSALLLCRANPDSEIFIFDTFEGLPEPSGFDNTHLKGDFSDTSEQQVRKLLAGYRNCRIYKGLFPEETGHHIQDKLFKLVHLDVDIYTSYKNSLEFFYPRMVRGGIVIMDDYASGYCLGAKKAIDNFMTGKSEILIRDPLRQAHFVKD